MRIPGTASASLFLFFCIAAGSAAAGEIHEPHAMLYYRVPLGAEADAARPGFGLRLDQTHRESGTFLDYSGLVQRPPLLGLEMGTRGVRSFTVAGMDYAGVLRADGEGETGAEGTAETQEDGRSIGQIIKETPKGWLIGIAIGIAIFAGAGD